MLFCSLSSMYGNEIFFHPHNKMILEYPFYNLVKEVRGEQFIDVSTWEVVCERLYGDVGMSWVMISYGYSLSHRI